MNRVNLIGRLGTDPEVKELDGDKLVANFSIAVQRTKDITDWIPVTAWDKSAEIARDWLHKGDRVGVDGSLKEDVWNDKESGQKRSKLKVEVHKFTLIGDKKGDSEQAPAKEKVAAGNAKGKKQTDEEIPF